MPKKVIVPLINPNEPEAQIAALFVENGQQVAEGDLLCTLETTKSTLDLPAEDSGYIVGLDIAVNQMVRAGDLLCFLADTLDWKAPEADKSPNKRSNQTVTLGEELPLGLRITQPALNLAQENLLDLKRLPTGPMVTESVVRSLIEKTSPLEDTFSKAEFDPTAIIIFGGGGHGKACLELVRSLENYHVVGFIDDGVPAGDKILGIPVIGGSDQLPDLYTKGVRLAVNAVGGIGNLAVRTKVFSILVEAGFAFPTIIHPTAFIEASAHLSPGVQVFPHAYIGSESKIGFGCIINTGSIVSHDCVLGDLANISPGAILAGEVKVASRVLIGMGVTINLKVSIGFGAKIGNGATIKSDVPINGIVRAGSVWPI